MGHDDTRIGEVVKSIALMADKGPEIEFLIEAIKIIQYRLEVATDDVEGRELQKALGYMQTVLDSLEE